jgi:hypothetical protein
MIPKCRIRGMHQVKGGTSKVFLLIVFYPLVPIVARMFSEPDQNAVLHFVSFSLPFFFCFAEGLGRDRSMH